LAATIVALTLALIVACGCSEQDQEVRKALGEANAHPKRFGEYIEDLKGLQKSLESVAEQPSTENTPEVKEILAAERKDEEAAHNEVKEAERSLKSAGELRVSKDMKVYLGMEASVFEE
jgi:hypothetical protein